MNDIISSLSPAVSFISTNLDIVIAIIVTILIFVIGYRITAYSLKKLKPDFFSYYPFDKFYPKSGKWSISYFVITILLLAILIFIIVRGEQILELI